MKIPSFLKKTIAGIPVWFLLSVAVALGAVYTVSKTISVSAKEPFSIIVEPTALNFYPGEYGLVKLKINNHASVTYGITVSTTADVEEPCVWEGYNSVDGQVINVVDADQGKFNIAPGEGFIAYKVSLPADAEGTATCSVSLSYTIERGAPFS
jgi:hypothetical protein